MDRLFNSHWFVRVIAFFVALMLFAMVNQDNLGNQPSVLPTISNSSYTLEEVELQVQYNEDDYVLTNAPNTVQVNLSGSRSALAYFQMMRPNYEVYIDVTELAAGEHRARIQYRGFPSELSVSVAPQTANIELQEIQTSSFPVQVDLLNTEGVEEGYTVGTPIVTPLNVDVTNASDWVAQVDMAKVFIDMDGADETLENEFPVHLYNEDGTELEMDSNPNFVTVRVPVTSPNKLVPVSIKRIGSLQDGLSIENIELTPGDVTVYGPSDFIESLDSLSGVELDLSKIEESTTVELDVPVPEGAEKVEPETISVEVTVDQEEERELSSVPLNIIGVTDNKTAVLQSDQPALISVMAYGTEDQLNRMSNSDFQAYVDISDSSAGDKELPIEFNGPQNIRFETEETDAFVTIRDQSE
ncbi:CdaR family protein [Alkalicoccobacillus porphyridii]|uniref:YbbR-like domain-containing protein n=1 Tax=Alkalicoccobacillus porphyridii TaxID=2597270 RepID=A0A554A2C0_9BACI|nr:CdaR family protein [Alkalicoccobacillus porphyridii]TSB47839.1 YbbR-like domain-containing protein [Alkalicoccobacillus porphyridii]